MGTPGNCYQDAAVALLDVPAFAGDDWVLVHGRPTLTREPFPQYGHAWLENRSAGLVFDAVSEMTLPIALYYRAGSIDPRQGEQFAYTRAQLRIRLMDHEHWGPWEGVEGVP